MFKKYLSRKFLVFIIATILLWMGKISDYIWLVVALVWLGLETLLDKVKGGI